MKTFSGFCLLVLSFAITTSCTTTETMSRQATSWTEIGNAWAELEKWDKAGDAWSRAIELDPKLQVASYNLVRALTEAGKYDEAIKRGKEILAQDPENALVISLLAFSLYKYGETDLAIAEYEKVIKLNAGSSSDFFNLAVLYEANGKSDDALLLYNKALEQNPDYPNALLRKAILIANKDKSNLEEAINLVTHFLSIKPDKEGRLLVAALYNRNQMYTEAIAIYDEILKTDEKDGATWFEKARLYLVILENENDGLEALKKAIDNSFKNKERYTELAENKDLVASEKVLAMLKEAKLYEPSTKTSETNKQSTPSGEDNSQNQNNTNSETN